MTVIHKHHVYGKKNDPKTIVELSEEDHRKLHGNIPNAANIKLRTAYKEYKLWQTERGRAERKLGSLRGELKNTTASPYVTDETFDILETQLTQMKEREQIAEKRVVALVRQTPEWVGFMKGQPGIREITAAMLISCIKIDIADTVSSLWSYLGYVPNPKNPSKRLENPGKAKAFKSPLYAALSIALIRKDNPYRQDYDKCKAKGLNHYKAINRITKLWLSHLWDAWRQWAELSTVSPYANNHLNHQGFIPKEDRGWEF